jgi:hypothetical protein
MIGTTTSRGYGYQHKMARRKALAVMRDGDPCSRCGKPMFKGQQLHLDHSDDRTTYLGLSHRRCNELAGARKGGRATARRKLGGVTRAATTIWRSREW